MIMPYRIELVRGGPGSLCLLPVRFALMSIVSIRSQQDQCSDPEVAGDVCLLEQVVTNLDTLRKIFLVEELTSTIVLGSSVETKKVV